MNATATLGGRIDTSRRALALAAGDLLCIAVFVVLGELQHGYDPLSDAGRVVGTAIPFFVGWALTSVLAGVYAPRVRELVRPAAARIALAWIGAALIGVALRATPVFHGDIAAPFVVVSLGVGLVLLLPWRVAYARRESIARLLARSRRSVTG